MKESLERLIRRYKDVQENYRKDDRSSVYSDLVTATTTQNYPVQRWFHFKEAFSIDLLGALIDEWGIDIEKIYRVLDPFCGTGTSILATQKLAKKFGRHDLVAIGIERNPFLHFVADTKTQWHHADADSIKGKAKYLLNGAPKSASRRLPELSSLRREDIFDRLTLRRIREYKSAIDTVDAKTRRYLLIGFASVIEELSGIRKDGRALRVVQKSERRAVDDALKDVWESIQKDLKDAVEVFQPINSTVLLGDGRTFELDKETNEDLADFDLIIYSPPYLNNIDYTEVYKLELWLSGFIENLDDFRSLRFKTFRSHPSVRFPELSVEERPKLGRDVAYTLKRILDALPNDSHLTWRRRLFTGYFEDIQRSLTKQFEALRDDGWVFCVVGNSMHGPNSDPESRVPVAADLLIASIAETVGFNVEAVQVARFLKRRAPISDFARESILVLRKIGGGNNR